MVDLTAGDDERGEEDHQNEEQHRFLQRIQMDGRLIVLFVENANDPTDSPGKYVAPISHADDIYEWLYDIMDGRFTALPVQVICDPSMNLLNLPGSTNEVNSFVRQQANNLEHGNLVVHMRMDPEDIQVIYYTD